MKDWIRNSVIRLFSLMLIAGLASAEYSSASNISYDEITNAQQIVITGQVVDADSGEPLAGVNITVRGRVVGVATDPNGEFTLRVNDDPPITLAVSIVGYRTQEIEITESNVSDLRIELVEETFLGSDVVVSASRVEESIMEAPVSIERMDILAINQTASDSYYKGIANLKGVDITTSSINFQIINARGFNSTGNTRMVQLTDGMDTQAPALNFPIGNLNGPSELDVESLEFIPGASSALYGPNAFNGILLVNSKSPFRYPGLSVFVRNGVNHIDSDGDAGEPNNPRHMFESSIRWADTVGDRFAYKLNFSYSQADDWRGINYSDKNSDLNFAGNPGQNPAYDGVHLYGDDGNFNIGLLSFNQTFVQGVAAQLVASPLPISQQDAIQFAQSLPSQPVARTGYREEYLVDHDAENLKFNTSLQYRITDNVEASYSMNYGYGTSVYSGAQRYSLNNFSIQQHKLQLDGDNFMVRAYGTFENSGDSYIADFVGFSVNDAYLGTQNWYANYGGTFVGGLAQAYFITQGNTNYDPAIVEAILSNPNTLANLHNTARGASDANRFMPGTQQFEAAKNAALEGTVPDGARFDDQSRFLHTEGQYDFKNEIDFVDLQVGFSYRQYQLRSNGTIFDDGDGGVDISEYGGYLQAAKSLFDDRWRLTGSLRYDKNENFDGQFNPRISSVLKVADGHNIRTSYQTGFRNPTTQGQYIDLNVLTARLLGGLPYLAEKYNVTENGYTLESVDRFTNEFLSGNQLAYTELQSGQFTEFNPVKPEQIQSYEIGYKGLIGNRLLIDAAYYYNIYDDFIAQFRVRRAAGPIDFTAQDPATVQQNVQTAASLLSGDASNTFQLYTNLDETVKSQGAVLGVDYSLPKGFLLTTNYNWNQLITDREDQFIFDYNTPEHKVNVSFGNRRLTEQIGFNLTYRWQEAFNWTSSFASGRVPDVSTLDAQVSYRIPDMKTVVKAGGSNILNNRHFLNYGGPNLGAIYYISLTFDQFLN
ncbi:TonB-dependent receptor [Rhodohalobacter sp.]|uniref:TonB-dependent receptor n=1 Tax=Rhodohalobacter sp. TaxID=1974210 RepID=UPI002ACD94B9|nr:TonB-dependent receptor [Rhodohalobacter sp.]MDZ7755279.1 TonB-dependent receptor [Rhodohalobacter sp.]